MVLELSRAQVSGWRLERHHLAERAPKQDLDRVVSDICGVQSQVLSSAALAIRARVRDVRLADVEDALWHRRTLVKTWCMRGTLHLLASQDLPAFVSAMTWTGQNLARQVFARRGRDPGRTEPIVSAIRGALDGRNLSREELAREVADRLRLDAGTRRELLSQWGDLLQPAAFAGALCFGPSRGAKVTFVRPDQWIGTWPKVRGERATKDLLRRFIHVYGPVTARDLNHWWGFSDPGKKQERLAMVSEELEPATFDGHRAWILKEDVRRMEGGEPAEGVSLLPSWDVYAMFYAPRELFIESRFRLRLFSPLRGNRPVVLVDGVAAGVWEQRRKGRRIVIEVQPFRPLAATVRRRIEEEARDIGEFYGATGLAAFANPRRRGNRSKAP